MKKLAMYTLLVLGLSVSASFAADNVPTNTLGGQTEPVYAGASSCMITNSTGTTNLLCTSGAGIILGIYGSSVAVTDQLVIRDSNTANSTSSPLIAVDLTALSKPAQMFPRFVNGLAVKLSVAPTAGNGVSEAIPAWTIVYRKVN